MKDVVTPSLDAVRGALGAVAWQVGWHAGYVTQRFLNSYRAARRQPHDVRSQMANRRPT